MLPLACKICGAAMASLNIAKGGHLEFCSRRGCKAHALGGTGNIDDMMSLMNRMFETPYDWRGAGSPRPGGVARVRLQEPPLRGARAGS